MSDLLDLALRHTAVSIVGVNFKGIVFPTHRRVLRRPPSGPLVTGPTAVWIQIDHVILMEGDGG